jgi:NADH-quinone oxidoreductase subunit K
MLNTNLFFYLFLNCFIFFIGLSGVFLFKKHLINILIFIELIVLSINLNFIVISYFIDDILGHIYCLVLLTVAAAESSIGLAILLSIIV